MEITRRTDYAVRIMRVIAENGTECPISVRAIAEDDGVPYQFARRISYDLTGAGLISVTRGARGGAILARPADQISLYDIVQVGQGDPICSRCSLSEEWCEHEADCTIRHTWEKLDVMVEKYLKDIKLSSIVRKSHKPETRKAKGKGAAKPKKRVAKVAKKPSLRK
jgi:Rrf2 family protein